MNEELLIESAERQEVSKFKDSIVKHLKKWPWILLSVAICLTIGYYRLKTKSDLYKVESKVYIKKNQQFSDPNELIFGGSASGFRRGGGIQDEAIIFKSFPLIKNALEELEFDVTFRQKKRFKVVELYKNCPVNIDFDRKSKTNLPLGINFQIQILDDEKYHISTERSFEGETLNATFLYNQPVKLGSFQFSIFKNKNSSIEYTKDDLFFISFQSIERAAYAYRDRLKFEEIEGLSSILSMRMTTAVPEKSIDFINKLVEKYIEESLAEKNKVAKNTVNFIDQQLQVISDSLNSREANLEDFKSSEQIASLSSAGESLIGKYNEIESERAVYEVKQQYYDYLQNTLLSDDSKNLENLIAPSAFGIEDLIVNELVIRLVDLNLARKKILAEGNLKSPLLTQIDNASIEVKSTLQESIDNLSKANKILLNTLDRRSDEISISAKKLPNSERKLVNLNRLLKLNENIYLFLMEKRSSAAITMSSNTPDCKVIEPAMLNPLGPISPNRKMTYLIAIIIGIFFPLIIFIGRDLLNDTIQSKSEVETGTQVPIIGTVPKTVINGSSMVVTERPKSSVAEAFRIIRSNLSFFQGKKSPFVILVTSSVAKEGKTYCALNLASILASSGKKTVIIGLDLRKPQLHNYMGLENEIGVSNYLSGRAELKEIVLSTKEQNLSLINSGSIPPNPAELLMKGRTKELISELKERFDYIIMDTPPVGIVTDALILEEESDINLYVIRQDYSKREFLDNLNELYTSKRMTNLSVLLNDVGTQSSYGYGYYEEEEEGLGGKLRRKVRKA